jgi:serine/threonine protein kinase/Tfp pilus assembly protein PilF
MSEKLGANSTISRYRITCKIGSGGMGEVYLAHDMRLNRRVALKVLPAEVVNNRNRLQRFEQEAQAASALNHPNIITIHEIAVEGDTHFIATEFIEGETLRRRLQTSRVSLDETLNITIQIAAALDAAHRSGIVHRDIKPENIMVREDGLVKVLDFGLAKSTENKPADVDTEAATRAQVTTQAGMILGTAAYMSPEQARGKTVDARSDIWSSGVVLYEMLTGHLPFLGETVSDTIAAILKSEPPVLDEHIPGELQRIVRKTLQKHADERYQTVKDLQIDLKNLKNDLEFALALERTARTSTNAQTKTGVEATRNTAHRVSSFEYASGEIKKHKVGLAVGLAILLLSGIGFRYWFNSGRHSPIESIAVMPFVNENGNADTDYLSDGMTELLISSLSQIPQLNVKASSTVFRYKGKNLDPRQVGTELRVQAVLTGRVVQHGDQLTLGLELVDATTENVIWTEQYNRKQADLVLLQSDIARDVAKKLKAKLSGVDESRVTRRYTDNAEAYEFYLKGRFFGGGKITEEELKKSIHYYQQAIEKDPNYALAYVGMARSYLTLGHVWGFLPPRETFPNGKAALMKALEIDETLGDAHTALADYYFSYEWNWLEAEQEFKRALALNPNDASAHGGYGGYFQAMERFDEAIAERKRCRELDPLSPTATANVGYPYYFAHQYDEAIGYYRKALDLDPAYSWSYLWIGQAQLGKGMYNEAISDINKAISLSEGNVRMKATLGYAYAAAGNRAEAQKIIRELKEQSKQKYVSPYFVAGIYSGLGDKDQAFAWLEQAYQERHPYLTLLKVEPVFDNLRSDPRFAELLRKVGLPL